MNKLVAVFIFRKIVPSLKNNDEYCRLRDAKQRAGINFMEAEKKNRIMGMLS